MSAGDTTAGLLRWWISGHCSGRYQRARLQPGGISVGSYKIWLVVTGTMEFYDFPYIGNVIIPTDEVIFFRGIETTNQKFMGISWGYHGDIMGI